MTAKLSEILAAGPPIDHRRSCRVCDWVKSLPDDDREAVESAIASPEWKTNTLYRVLFEQGLQTSDNTFRRHKLEKHQTSTKR